MGNWQQALDSMKSTILSEIVERTRHSESASVTINTSGQHYHSFGWNDGLISHGVPKNWEWPKRLPVKGLMDMWWHGSDVMTSPRPGEEPQRMHIRPFCMINRKFDISTKDQVNYSRARVVALHMEDIITTNGLLPAGIAKCVDLSIAQGDEVFGPAYELLLVELRAIVNMKRETELCYGTVYTSLNKIKQANGPRRRGRVEIEEQDI
jgi:hypothetical protein